ncbi:glyoxylate/hydroxypyruvate reductase A-like [Microplitis mediator]|uniref:glyoxylate/hydroxypyruvate reductase A-like n=1 Tax=Microplitis mediator TaxID=375433 RepID=UPI00255630A9|nr:glyoxylate/hydroxypyruvate reductase A-like [Microplitis mediator]
MNRVVVYTSMSILAQHIQKIMPELEFININPDNSVESLELDNVEIMIADCRYLPKIKNKLNNIKWIQSISAGVEQLVELRDEKNINFVVTRFVDDVYGIDMAEYIVMQIVAHERRQKEEYERLKSAVWPNNSMFVARRLISQMNIGIMGVGNIGKVVAKSLKNFGAKIWGLKRTVPTIKEPYIDEYRTTNLLPEFLSNCDYIINIMPATPETDGLLNGDVLKNCKENNTIFINVGRGNIIKESDLVTALENKWIAAAILDVFEVEPLPPTSKLWTMPQVTITPHNACTVRPEGIAKLFKNNYEKYIKGEPLPNILDFKRGY